MNRLKKTKGALYIVSWMFDNDNDENVYFEHAY